MHVVNWVYIHFSLLSFSIHPIFVWIEVSHLDYYKHFPKLKGLNLVLVIEFVSFRAIDWEVMGGF